jgi:hypothetical protein
MVYFKILALEFCEGTEGNNKTFVFQSSPVHILTVCFIFELNFMSSLDLVV